MKRNLVIAFILMGAGMVLRRETCLKLESFFG